MTVDTSVRHDSPVGTDPEAKGRAMAEAIAEIYAYVRTPRFLAVLAEMNTLATLPEKDAFVRTVLLDPEQLERRGVKPPEGIVVQRSRFEDARPTVFCVVKYLPSHREKMTITFDQSEMPWPVEID
jgi:hypothetical protein